MLQMSSLKTGFLAATLAVAAGVGVVASPNVASADDCGKLKIEAVKKVCKSGGVKAVKDAMKKAQKAAKKAGVKVNGKPIGCKSCHKEQKTYTLTDNAVADFKKHMAPNF